MKITQAQLFDPSVEYGVGENPQSVAIGDLDGDGNLDLATANYYGDDVSVLLGNGDGTFQAAANYGVGENPKSVAIGDLDGDGDQDLVTPNCIDDNVSVLINRTESVLDTFLADLTCQPSSGVVPFTTNMVVTLDNLYIGQTRRFAGRINLTLAVGSYFPNWRAGYTNVAAGDSYITSWNMYIPNFSAVIGSNYFLMVAEDVTPAPYNQPPYPPSGDTDTSACTVTGVAP